ncbi:MAG TPA: AMP-binding protein [Bacteroidota bacterium]|nr:AMP-binding protein [Bacteroidota bacterium]
MLIHEYLSRTATRLPEKTALVCGKLRASYRMIDERAKNFAAFLRTQELERGDRVAVFIDSSLETVVAIFGILEAGGCLVIVNPSTHAERLGFILNDAGAKFIVASVEKLATVEQALKNSSLPARPGIILTGPAEDDDRYMSFEQVTNTLLPFTPVKIIDADLAAIIYTSGSTGQPKGVTHLHRTINSVVDVVAEYLEHTENDVILGLLPLSSSYGLLQVLVTFKTGGRIVLERGFGYPYEIIQRLKDERVTGFAGAPTVYAIMLKLEGLEREDFSHLRYLTNAAAALPAAFIPQLRKIFPQAKIYLMHGLTECLRTTFLPPDEIDIKPTSVGSGMKNVELWLEDASGNRVPQGQVGEMMVRGSNIMQGYWNDPESTAKVLKPGRYPWERVLRTRDLFVEDEDGDFHFVAREDELIKSRGEKVSPVEVEDVLYRLDAVQETRVIGVPDGVLGQAIRAEIVLKENRTLTAQEVKAHCRKNIEDFKVPHHIEFVDSLPKTQGGKIKRTEQQ